MIKLFLPLSLVLLTLGCNEKAEKQEAKPGSAGDTAPSKPSPGHGQEAGPSGTRIVCDRFDLQVDLQANTLKITLDTDLPEYTNVTVSVSRSYLEKGNTAVYSIEYFSEKAQIKNWKTPREIPLNNEKWLQALRDKQDQLSRSGLGFEVESVFPVIQVRVVVPVNQSDPRFGDGNANLTGKAVSPKRMRIVESKSELAYPIDSRTVAKKRPSLDPQNLDLGPTYLLSRETPLMPGLSPDDPDTAIGKIIRLAPGTAFTILEKRHTSTDELWYRVHVPAQKGSSAAKGWFNSIALAGQELRVK